VIPIDELLDKESKQFKKRNLEFMVYDTEDVLLNDPLLLKTPIVRNGKLAAVGFQPDTWKDWIKEK
jgi:arsenate reductase-like glutaredoxin family protein